MDNRSVSLQYAPKKGMILLCDFSQGFKEPEMVKSSRPVIVLCSTGKLATVVACSTKEPEIIKPYHYLIPRQSMPKTSHFFGKDTWVKGDMVYTFGFHRLDLVDLGKTNGKRNYFTQRFGSEQMANIHRCVLSGIGFDFLVGHITT